MEKRYQVFISSTFQDLKNARQEVSQALLRADCFPAGMELFPAADEEQFEFIKTIIDQSDYYILISAGRYGSIHPETGLSYTEMEYDYAVKTGKPIIRLLHKNPKSVADEGDEKLVKLLTFQNKLKNGRMVAFWETPSELGRETAFALLELKKSKPAIGWAKADQVSTTEASLLISQLKEENRLLTANLNQSENKDFRPLLNGLGGEILLQKYVYNCEAGATDDPFLSATANELEIKHRLRDLIYSKSGGPFSRPTAWVIECICFGLLFSSDISTALQEGLSSEHPIGTQGSHLLKLETQKSLEAHFMALESAGLLIAGDQYSSSFMDTFEDSLYVSRNRWILQDDFRRWLVGQPRPSID